MDQGLEKLIRLLTDSYAVKILTNSYGEEKSAIELSQELNVPIAACYRRLHQLAALGLVTERERTTPRGKKIKYYHSNVKRAVISIEGNRLTVEIISRDGKSKKYRSKILPVGYGK